MRFGVSSAVVETRAATPGATSMITTRFSSPASPKSRGSREPAYSAGAGEPGTRCGAWMCPIAMYCGPGGSPAGSMVYVSPMCSSRSPRPYSRPRTTAPFTVACATRIVTASEASRASASPIALKMPDSRSLYSPYHLPVSAMKSTTRPSRRNGTQATAARPAAVSRCSTPPPSGRLMRPTRCTPMGATSGARTSNSSPESWLPAIATTARRPPSARRTSAPMPSPSASVGGVERSHRSPDTITRSIDSSSAIARTSSSASRNSAARSKRPMCLPMCQSEVCRMRIAVATPARGTDRRRRPRAPRRRGWPRGRAGS